MNNLLIYEHRNKPLISTGAFLRRLARHGGIALAVIIVSLGVGMIGYRVFAGLGWIDSFLNAAMILGGMGPVDRLTSDKAKLFAGCYALYSGLVLLISVGIIMSPVVHRLIHKFHLAKD